MIALSQRPSKDSIYDNELDYNVFKVPKKNHRYPGNRADIENECFFNLLLQNHELQLLFFL
jgi:hypothetical protein